MHRRSLVASLAFLSCLTTLPACAPQTPTPHAAPASQPSRAGNTVTALDASIFYIFQAADSTYWFGSDGQGVYHYDGSSIRHFTTEHGLCGNRIRGIQQDRAGNILVKSDGHDKHTSGLSRFDGRAFHPVPVANPIANTNPTTGDWRLDPNDLWFIGWQDEGVVYRYDGAVAHRLAFPTTAPGEDHIARYPRAQFPSMQYNPYDVYTIYKDSRGHLWFGTGILGACRYDGTSFAWISREELEFGEPDGFGVRSIIEDKNGSFWFSRTKHRFDIAPSDPAEHGNTALKYSTQPGIAHARGEARDSFTHIMSSVKDKGGTVWMATLDGSVWRYDGESVSHYPVREGNKVVRLFSIYRDKQGTLWLGTHEHGAYRFNGTAFEPFKP